MSFQSFLSKTLHFLRSLLVSSYLAGNHGKTNRGSLKITNLKQYKNHSVFEITQNDHSLPFFHPSRYGGHIAGYFFSVTGRAPQLDALSLPLQQLPQPKLPHAKPAAAVAARSVPQQKRRIQWNPHSAPAWLDDPMGNYGSRGSSSRGRGPRWSKHCTTRCCMALTEPTWRRLTKNPWSFQWSLVQYNTIKIQCCTIPYGFKQTIYWFIDWY